MDEFHFSVPGAARLASLAGLRGDLSSVDGYCGRMIERYAGAHLKKSPFDIVGFTTHVDFVDWEALSTAASVAYARCFLSGVRQSLDPALLSQADVELRETHEFVLHMRNKHVAHSVNSFEENSVTVHVEDSFVSPSQICSVVPRSTRQSGFSFDLPAKLKRLAQWWLERVREEEAVETQVVLQLAKAMSLAEVRALGELKSSSAQDRRSTVGKRRIHP